MLLVNRMGILVNRKRVEGENILPESLVEILNRYVDDLCRLLRI